MWSKDKIKASMKKLKVKFKEEVEETVSVELDEKVSLSKKGNYEVSVDGKSSVGIRIGLYFKGKLIVPGTKQKGLFVMGFNKKDGKHKLPPGATIIKDSGKYVHIGFKKVDDIIAYAVIENIVEEGTEYTSFKKYLGEAYKYIVDHKQYEGAIQEALRFVSTEKYDVVEEEFFREVLSGPKKPSEGKTNSFSLSLTKNGKPQRKKLQIQITGTSKSKMFELNTYIK
jgi:hypothetical protein